MIIRDIWIDRDSEHIAIGIPYVTCVCGFFFLSSNSVFVLFFLFKLNLLSWWSRALIWADFCVIVCVMNCLPISFDTIDCVRTDGNCLSSNLFRTQIGGIVDCSVCVLFFSLHFLLGESIFAPRKKNHVKGSSSCEWALAHTHIPLTHRISFLRFWFLISVVWLCATSTDFSIGHSELATVSYSSDEVSHVWVVWQPCICFCVEMRCSMDRVWLEITTLWWNT